MPLLLAPGRNLLNIVEEVSLLVLCFCDISGVLAASQTCRHLHMLAFDKQVWLALLRRLDARLFLDQLRLHGQSLHELSTADLINLAKRIVQGPQTWSPVHPGPPTIARQYVLHPGDIDSGWGEAKLLSGGRHVLFNNRQCLECWNVEENRLIWKHQGKQSRNVTEFAAEVVNDGQAANIVICFNIFCSDSGSYKNFVEIVHLDFLTESSSLPLITRAPDSGLHDDLFHRDPTICGDLAAVSGARQVLLMKWKTQCAVLLSFETSPNIALVHKHVIMIELAPVHATGRIGIFNIESLHQYWTPCNEFTEYWTPVSTRDVPKITFTTFELASDRPTGCITLLALQSPVREDSYTIWVLNTSVTPREDFAFHCTIWKFSLFFPTASLPRLRLRTSGYSNCQYDLRHNISYTGHMEIDIEGVLHLLVLPSLCGDANENETISTVELPDHGGYAHVSTYSGALTYLTRDTIVVDYYE